MSRVRVALLYEHPTWTSALVETIRLRRIHVEPFDVGNLPFGVHSPPEGYDLWVNRVNTMPSDGRGFTVVDDTRELLRTLEASGAPVINGARTHEIGCSKIGQTELYTDLGLATPEAIPITHPTEALPAATQIGFPLVTKPNIGGSGAGITRHESPTDLEAAVQRSELHLGPDGTGLVQRFIEAADGLVHRLEILDGRLLYATSQPIQEGAFNYCAADGCSVDAGAIEIEHPPEEVIDQAVSVVDTAGGHLGSVEYLIDPRTGEPSFYDFNPFSNFVAGFDDELGFSPNERFTDFLIATVSA